MARGLFQERKTAPMAPQSWAFGSSGNRPHFLLDLRLYSRTRSLRSWAAQFMVKMNPLGLLFCLQEHLKGVLLVFTLGFEPQDHVAVHRHKAPVAVIGEPLVTVRLIRPCTVVSLSPRFRIVSIIPACCGPHRNAPR